MTHIDDKDPARRRTIEPLIQEHDPHHLQRPKLVRENDPHLSENNIADGEDHTGFSDGGLL